MRDAVLFGEGEGREVGGGEGGEEGVGDCAVRWGEGCGDEGAGCGEGVWACGWRCGVDVCDAFGLVECI